MKRTPYRYREPGVRNWVRWENRTYPCSRWFCFRRSPAWRAFERHGRHYCDRHVPPEVDA